MPRRDTRCRWRAFESFSAPFWRPSPRDTAPCTEFGIEIDHVECNRVRLECSASGRDCPKNFKADTRRRRRPAPRRWSQADGRRPLTDHIGHPPGHFALSGRRIRIRNHPADDGKRTIPQRINCEIRRRIQKALLAHGRKRQLRRSNRPLHIFLGVRRSEECRLVLRRRKVYSTVEHLAKESREYFGV